MLGINEMARYKRLWDIPYMASRPDKKESAQRSALTIAERLEDVKPSDLSERQWTQKAGVSPSFFSNLRGTPTKPPSDPSVDQLRQVLRVVRVSLAEFFLPEADGALARAPSRRAVEQAIADALPSLPSKAADRARYLAEVVAGVLALPSGLQATPDAEDQQALDAPEEGVLPRAATKRI
jgi:hypothetical protein